MKCMGVTELQLYHMEDNKPLISTAPTVPWTLSFCIVQYLGDFLFCQVVLGLLGLAFQLDDDEESDLYVTES